VNVCVCVCVFGLGAGVKEVLGSEAACSLMIGQHLHKSGKTGDMWQIFFICNFQIILMHGIQYTCFKAW
jgi:hypothetical protein